MLGLAVLFVLGLYIALSIAVVWGAVHLARRRGVKGWKYGVPAGLFMYLLVFWDHIPTLIMHKHYCDTEAGFWVYKTPEQWMQENPGVVETLVASKGVKSSRVGDMDSYTDTYVTNQRFRWVVSRSGPHRFNLWRHEQTVVDAERQEVLARYVDFSRGYGNALELGSRHGLQGMKIWLVKRHCDGGERDQSLLRKTRNELLGKELR